MSSNTHYESYAEGIRSYEDMQSEAKYDRIRAYAQTKLANVLHAQELAERLADKKILVNSVHPGGVGTEIGRYVIEGAKSLPVIGAYVSDLFSWAFHSFWSDYIAWHPRDAAWTQIYTAVGPSLIERRISGKYFHPIARLQTPHAHAVNRTMQKALWDLSEKVTAM